MAHLTVRGPCVWIVVLCSPAFGELSGYQFAHTFMGSKEDRKAMWGDAPIEVSHTCLFQRPGSSIRIG